MTADASKTLPTSHTKKRFNRKILILIICALIGMGYGAIRYSTPDVIIVNNTGKQIFVRRMQITMSGDEPTDAEVAQLKRIWVIQPGEEQSFPVFLSVLFSRKAMLFSLSWRIGSQFLTETNAGEQAFLMGESAGAGRWRIQINEDSVTVTPIAKAYTYKKLAPPPPGWRYPENPADADAYSP